MSEQEAEPEIDIFLHNLTCYRRLWRAQVLKPDRLGKTVSHEPFLCKSWIGKKTHTVVSVNPGYPPAFIHTLITDT